MPNALTHDQCRLQICLMCGQKGSSMKEILPGSVLLQRVNKYQISNYSPDNLKLPKGICARDRKLLLDVDSQKLPTDRVQDPPDFSEWDFGGLTSRQLLVWNDSTECKCTICNLAKVNRGTPGNSKEVPFTLGRPRQQPLSKPVKICPECFLTVEKGKSHQCNLENRRKNLQEHLSKDPRGMEMAAAKVVRDKVSEASTSDQSIELRTGGGKTMVMPNPKRQSTSKALHPDSPVLAAELRTVMTGTGLSNKKAEEVASSLRTLKGRDFFEPNVMGKIRDMDRILDEFYTAKIANIHTTDKEEIDLDENGKVRRWMFYTHRRSELVNTICKMRGYHSQTEIFIKIYLDAGGSWLKVCMTIEKVQGALASPDVKSKQRFSYQEGPMPNKFKDSGVKKVIPIAFIQSAQESYENLELITLETGLNVMDFTPACDMKMGLTLYGLGTAASKCPCIWCDLAKHLFGDPEYLFKGGNLRTFKSIEDSAMAYQTAAQAHTGAGKLSSKNFASCEHKPLFDVDDKTLYIVQVMPPMELHILLGLGNDLFKYLDRKAKNLNCGGAVQMLLRDIGAKQSKHHGGHFNGNTMIRVLQSVGRLRSILSRSKALEQIGPIIDAMETLDAVRQACFAKTLDDDFEKEIRQLGNLWRQLKLSVTPKAHALFVHVAQFLHFNNLRSSPKHGLGYWSEHTGESIHYDFETFWKSGYKVEIGLDENYRNRNLMGICTYAARHV